MLGNVVEIKFSSSLVLGWAPYHYVLGAQLAPGEKKFACIPDLESGRPCMM